jgi:hypothetical protein
MHVLTETKVDLISQAALMDNIEFMAEFEDGFFRNQEKRFAQFKAQTNLFY